MLQLLHPIWLMAMAGISFPVIIHLWNNRQGKVLPVGSIAFLEKGSRRQARSRKLSDWWLLMLRCGLLLLLALLLSGPFWRNTAKAVKTRGWVLGEKEDAQAPAFKALVDSLLKAGYEWHEWSAPSSYWDLFRAADREAPAGIPFYIFTSGRRSGFTGKRPASDRVVHWASYTPSADSGSQWIEQAWFSYPDSIWVLTGSSRSTCTSYSIQQLPAKAGMTSAVWDAQNVPEAPGSLHVGFTNGYLSVALDSQPPMTVDTASLRIWIYADYAYTNDSRYLAAAFHALQQFTRRGIHVSIGGGIFSPKPKADWLFWLSSTPVPGDLSARNIVRYEPGREISVDTWMQGVTGVAVSKRIEPDNAYPAIWKDGFGQSLLSIETRSGRRVFHFFSHFDPAWNGLVWSPRFPVLLQDLLVPRAFYADLSLVESTRDGNPAGPASIAHDQRVLDPEQILPQKISPEEPAASPEKTPDRTDYSAGESGTYRPSRDTGASDAFDLAPACWVLILLFFAAERMVSFRSPKIKSYG